MFSCDFFFCLFIFICLSVCCYHQGQGTAQIGEGRDNSWIVLDDDDDDDKEMKDNDEIEIADEKTMTPDTVTQSSQQKNGSKGDKKQCSICFIKYRNKKNVNDVIDASVLDRSPFDNE